MAGGLRASRVGDLCSDDRLITLSIPSMYWPEHSSEINHTGRHKAGPVPYVNSNKLSEGAGGSASPGRSPTPAIIIVRSPAGTTVFATPTSATSPSAFLPRIGQYKQK
jgi:hypothetical protein